MKRHTRLLLPLVIACAAISEPDMLFPRVQAAEEPSIDRSELMKKVERSVCRIFVQTKRGISTGTGFFVYGGGLMITNAHVVEGATDVLVFVLSPDMESATAWPASIVVTDKVNDLCLLKVAGKDLPKPLGVGLRGARGAEVLEEVIAVGYPGAIDTRISQAARFDNGYTRDPAILENLTPNITKGAVSKATSKFITHDAKIAKGSSGGPLISLVDGMVVGVNTVGVKDSMSTFYMAVPSSYLIKLAARGMDILENQSTEPAPPIDSDSTYSELTGGDEEDALLSPDELSSSIKQAEAGDARAAYRVAIHYISNDASASGYGKAFPFLKKAEEFGCEEYELWSLLGLCYELGFGTKLDLSKARKYFEMAVQSGLSVDKFRYGVFLHEHGRGKVDQANAEKFMVEAADAGLTSAQAELGIWYTQGLGVEEDIIKAVGYLSLAAEAGHAYAQTNLGKMYLNGQGVTKDWDKAEQLLLSAAKQGVGHAHFLLSHMYDKQGNQLIAIKHAQEAAKLGEPHAAVSLALRYLDGDGVMRSPEQAKKWLRVAAGQDEYPEIRDEAKRMLARLSKGSSGSSKKRNSTSSSSRSRQKGASTKRQPSTGGYTPKPAKKAW